MPGNAQGWPKLLQIRIPSAEFAQQPGRVTQRPRVQAPRHGLRSASYPKSSVVRERLRSERVMSDHGRLLSIAAHQSERGRIQGTASHQTRKCPKVAVFAQFAAFHEKAHAVLQVESGPRGLRPLVRKCEGEKTSPPREKRSLRIKGGHKVNATRIRS